MSNAIVLIVRGIGPVPAMKNSKMIARGRLITHPTRQKWMEMCIQSFVSQCCSRSLITGDATSTEPCPLSLTVSSMPEDDCWTIIPQQEAKATHCDKGQEGAIITIERIE